MAYEGEANRAIVGRRMIAVCSYDLKKACADDVFSVVRNHQFTLDRQGECWEVVESVRRPPGV
jgi:hypothetical protein